MADHYFQEQRAEINCSDAWAEFGNTGVLESWVTELREICQSEHRSLNTWQIAGRAVVIVHAEKSQQLSIVRKVAYEAGMNLIELTEDKFVEWVNTNHVPVDLGPALVYVPQGGWSEKNERGASGSEPVCEFRKALPGYLGSLDPDLPLVFVTIAGCYMSLTHELRIAGSFDRRFNVTPLTEAALGERFVQQVGMDLCDTSLTEHLAKVGHLIQVVFSNRRRQGLIALAMKRRAARQRRLLGFDDLVHFSVFGSQEIDYEHETDPDKRRRVAIHEAGHAIVAIIDSEGKDIPDYVGIVGSSEFKGFASDSFAYTQTSAGHESFKDLCHKIRISLGGRVAEAVILGAEHVGCFGARSDLINASNMAKDLMGKCGFTASYCEDNAHAVNLAVYDADPTLSEARVIEEQARQFLLKQYQFVEAMLREHEPILLAVCNSLLEKHFLTQGDLIRILREQSPVELQG